MSRAHIGPRNDWGDWRRRRDKALANPRKNAAALRLNAELYHPISSAPLDGTLLLLLVENTTGATSCNPIEDEALYRTIGFNNFDHDGNDEWKLAGWNWENDHFTEGHGKPKYWRVFPKGRT